MKALAQQAQDPNSIYYSPTFSQQYNNYSQNQTHNNPYQEVMDAMSAASDNYNNQNNNGYYGNNQNTAVNPYEELMKMLEKESQNPNSPYYSPNASQNQNNNNNNYNNQNYQNYNAPANSSQNPYELAAQELIKAAEESSRQAQNNNNYNDPYNNYAQNGGYNDPNNYGAADNYNNTANNYGAADNYNNTQDNYGNANQQNNNFYTPFEVPQAVLDTAKRTYPNAEIWAIDMEYIDIYEIKMSNMMELYIDKTGKLLYQQFDD